MYTINPQVLEAEDHYEGERKDLTERLEALDSIVRMLELKHKNSLDHASRLEERENDLKKVSSLVPQTIKYHSVNNISIFL